MKLKLTTLRYLENRNTRKGSYTLEAAILLPLFIVGVLTLGFTIRMISAAENITFAATDEARLIAGSAYNIPIAPFFSTKLQSRIIDENPNASLINVGEFRYLYQSQDYDGLISFRLNYWIEAGLPLGMIDGMDVTQRYRCRGFIGRTDQGTPISFDDMEKNSTASMVWLFPDGGKKYHSKSCTYVTSYPVLVILNEDIQKQYEPCTKCNSETAEIGSLVCCFQAYGEAYHQPFCPTVDKYIISMEKNQAEARGYVPCLKCGGVQ